MGKVGVNVGLLVSESYGNVDAKYTGPLNQKSRLGCEAVPQAGNSSSEKCLKMNPLALSTSTIPERFSAV